MKLLQPETEIVPGKPGNRPTVSPVPDKQSIPGSAVLRLTNTSTQENAYTIRLRCGDPFWQEAWYTVIALQPTAQSAPAGGKPDQRGPQDRWVKIYVPRGGARDILIRFNVPQRPDSRAGRYRYQVEVETQVIGPSDGARRSDRVSVLPAVAVVRPYYKWGIDLTPEQKRVTRVRRGTEFEVNITNEGNDWLYCDLQIPRPKDMTVECETLRLAVPPPEPGELLAAEPGSEERPGTQRGVPLRAATKLKIFRGALTAQPLVVSAVRVDAPSVPAADTAETGGTEGAVVASPTSEARQLPGARSLMYAPPIPATLTDFFAHSAGSLRTLIMTFLGLVLAAHMAVLLFQRYRFDAMNVEPGSSNADAGAPLEVRGHFLEGAQILMGNKTDGFTQVPVKVDLKHADRVIITSVPPEFNHKAMQLKAQRFVALFPLLTPLLPSATSKTTVQVGSMVVTASPEITQLASGALPPGKPFSVGVKGFDEPGVVLLNNAAVNAHWGTDTVTVPVPTGAPGQTFIVTVKPHDSAQALDAGSITIASAQVAALSGATGGPKPAGGGGAKPASGSGSKPAGGGGAKPASGGSGSKPAGGGSPQPAGGGGGTPTHPIGTKPLGGGGGLVRPPVVVLHGNSQAAYTALLADDLAGAQTHAQNSDAFGQAILAYVCARQGNFAAAEPLIAATVNSSDARTKAMALTAQGLSLEASSAANAVQKYEEASAADPTLVLPYGAKATLLYKNRPTQTERDAADQALKAGLAQAQTPSEKGAVFYALGKIYASTNRPFNAKQAFDRAHGLNPSLAAHYLPPH